MCREGEHLRIREIERLRRAMKGGRKVRREFGLKSNARYGANL